VLGFEHRCIGGLVQEVLRMSCEASDFVHILPRVRAVAEVKRGARVVTTALLRLGFRGIIFALLLADKPNKGFSCLT
jgi:hypothetical protein